MDNNKNKGSVVQFLKKAFGILKSALYYLGAGILYMTINFGPGFIFIPLLLLIIFPCAYFSWRTDSSFEPFDLLARFFGIGLGAILGLLSAIIALTGFGIINYHFSRKKNKDSVTEKTSNVPDEETTKTAPSKPGWLKGCLIGYILFPLLWVTFSILAPSVYGFYHGLEIDASYASYHLGKNLYFQIGIVLEAIFVIGIILVLLLLLLKKSERASYSKRHRGIRFRTGIYLVLFAIITTCIGTEVLCRPSIPYKDKKLESGVYLYTNNTTYNVTGINIYSSRCGGFSHSGFCLITKDPRGENAQRKKLGLEALRFTKLQRGYYVNMLSMAVPDQDGFTNYQSRCYPQENAYDFDVDALKNYLAGHSPNDLPAPALRMMKLSTDDYRKTWNRIVELGKQYDKLFHDGMVYSPVPYTDKNVKTINCNTYSGSILDTLIKEKLINSNGKQTVKEFEKLINPPFSFGGQTMADGQKLNEFFAQDDASEQVERHWEFVKTAPLSEQNFWANALRPDGRYGKSLSKLVKKPED